MSDIDRDAIFGSVRKALSVLPKRAECPSFEDSITISKSARNMGDRWEHFCREFVTVHGKPMVSPAELAVWLREQKALHGYCDPALAPLFQSAFGSDIKLETVFDRTRVDDYAFGITRATGAIAETGTIILDDQRTSSRLGSLAPWIHVACFKKSEILPDIVTALGKLPQDPNIIWITGPSKTADIEGILIEGVHGPGVQIALLLEE